MILLAGIGYGLLAGQSAQFEVQIDFDGYLPVLGGKEAKATVKMAIDVAGLNSESGELLRASSEIAKFQMVLDEAELPFTANNVRAFFPKTTVSFNRRGKATETDAPKTKLPVRLPGLDSQRFPEITYLPLELPAAEEESFEFTRAFNGLPVKYSVTRSADQAFKFTLNQTGTRYQLPDGSESTSENPKARGFTFVLSGSGTAKFDPARGLFSEVKVSAVQTETPIAGGSDRKLKTDLRILLKKAE